MATLKAKITETREKAIAAYQKALAICEAKATISPEERKQADDFIAEHDLLMADVARLEVLEAAEAKHRTPGAGLPVGSEPPAREGDVQETKGRVRYDEKGRPIFPEGPFSSLGEQLQAVANHFTHKGTDPRLMQVKALGSNEEIFSEGGALLQPNFAYAIFSKGYELANVASRCRRITVGPGSNGVPILVNGETSRASGSRWGGLTSYWVGPGTAATASKPKFDTVDLRLKKLMITAYATDELLEDAAAMTSLINQAAQEEMAWQLNEAVLAGTGAGQPLGIKNATCLVEVAKEAGQAADTIVALNIEKMWARCWAGVRPGAIWVINQDCEPQLDQLSLTVGLGGVPIYMPPGGLADAPYGRLKGRPVLISESAETVGDKGDIYLGGFDQYAIEDKGGVQSDLSIHVAFLTDESCFRFTYRADGSPMWKSALTPAKGSNTLSPFVALAARA